MKTENYINHIGLVLDASGSMSHLSSQVTKVADNQIAHLAKRSKELDQETRVTVYAFQQKTVDCLIFDKDVLRLPSIASLYKIGGQTNLIDATLKAIQDLEDTSTLYGEHAFLLYVLTDGEENYSFAKPDDLSKRIAKLEENWTVATFVPNQTGVHEAKKFGFPSQNIAVWDTTSKGLSEVGETIRRTTDTFMTGRSKGVRGYKNLFQVDVVGLNAANLSGLDRRGPGQFRRLEVKREGPIAAFIEYETGRPYRLGEAYYQLTKPVTIQASKTIALYKRKEHTVYHGDGARKLIGLPDHDVKVNPATHPDFDIFVQSTSVNRKLVPGTHVLML